MTGCEGVQPSEVTAPSSTASGGGGDEGELPDAADFGDEGSNTLGHVLDSQHPQLPTLTKLGLLHTLPTPATTENPGSAFGRTMVRPQV